MSSIPGNTVLVTLQRGRETADGTHGSLYKDGVLLCYTLEKPWRNNEQDVSCVPAGVYQVVRHGWETNTPLKHKRVWELLNVPGRTGVLIHEGNTLNDTDGCILVGLGTSDGGVSRSQDALTKLRGIFPGGFTLEIINA